MKIVEVRLTTCRVPLSSPIVMGELRFDGREYLVVELVTDDGLTGVGFGMTRDAPVARDPGTQHRPVPARRRSRSAARPSGSVPTTPT